MKSFLVGSLIFQCLITFGQRTDKNILSYYAVTNSIDGQPFIDKQNLLRFYPVFAFRESVRSVKITIYYGNEVFIGKASRQKNGLYWEIKLPEFDLGDAIQRYEVETVMKYETDAQIQIAQYKKIMMTKQADFSGKLDEAKKNVESFQTLVTQLTNCFSELNSVMSSNKLNLLQLQGNVQSATDAVRLPAGLPNSYRLLYEKIDSLIQHLPDSTDKKDVDQIKSSVDDLSSLYKDLNQSFFLFKLQLNAWIKTDTLNQKLYQRVAGEILKTKAAIDAFAPDFYDIGEKQKEVLNYITIKERVADTLKKSLINTLTDKTLIGSGIQKSDIVFEGDSVVRVLYRNYQDENRHLVVLDPAEKLSIFKIRYIPFPVVGQTLAGPNQEGVPIVFEAGVTFGNQVVTSNEFYKPSIERFGIAFAFTPQLFSKDAKILALLLTYDFNTYASIGVGANFGTGVTNDPSGVQQRKLESYFSFGINQKAFQRLVTGIGSLFK